MHVDTGQSRCWVVLLGEWGIPVDAALNGQYSVKKRFKATWKVRMVLFWCCISCLLFTFSRLCDGAAEGKQAGVSPPRIR